MKIITYLLNSCFLSFQNTPFFDKILDKGTIVWAQLGVLAVSPQDSIAKLVSAQCHPLCSAICSPNSFSRRLFILRILSAYLMASNFEFSSLRDRSFGNKPSEPASKSSFRISLSISSSQAIRSMSDCSKLKESFRPAKIVRSISLTSSTSAKVCLRSCWLYFKRPILSLWLRFFFVVLNRFFGWSSISKCTLHVFCSISTWQN